MAGREAIRIPREKGRPLAGDLHIPADTKSPQGGGSVRGPGDSAGREGLGAVLVIHGFKGFKDWGFFPHLCDALAEGGLLALRFNVSGAGIREDGDRFDDPEAFESNTYGKELRDIALAAAFLRARGEAMGRRPKLGLLGVSRGGGMAILHAAADRSIQALATWAAISYADRYDRSAHEAWERGETVPVANVRTGQVFQMRGALWEELRNDAERFDILRAAGRIDLPWLIVHGDADDTVKLDEGTALHRAARDGMCGERARLLILQKTGHTFGGVHPFRGETPPMRKAIRETVRWFAAHLDTLGEASGAP